MPRNSDFSSAACLRWQEARQRELAAPDSWQGLIGLFWLAEGDNPVSDAVDATVQVPGLEGLGGSLRWQDGSVVWCPSGGAEQPLDTDHRGQPTVVRLGHHEFFIVERQGRLAARVRDLEWASRKVPLGVDFFPVTADWRIEADWVALVPPRTMEVPNVSGDLQVVEVAFEAVFMHEGETVRLLPMTVGDNEVFFVFRDRTSGRDSYGAGRFLKAKPAVDGQIVLDFNFAYSPPCAFTPFATCPLPPPENWLPFAVPAGEKKPVQQTS